MAWMKTAFEWMARLYYATWFFITAVPTIVSWATPHKLPWLTPAVALVSGAAATLLVLHLRKWERSEREAESGEGKPRASFQAKGKGKIEIGVLDHQRRAPVASADEDGKIKIGTAKVK